MFVHVNGGNVIEALCTVTTTGPTATQLIVCGIELLLQMRAFTLTHAPGGTGTCAGMVQTTLHLPDWCAFHNEATSAAVRARLKISTSSIGPWKKLFAAGNVPAP